MVWKKHKYDDIPGTYVFDGKRAHSSYALNKLFYSFNEQRCRAEFDADPAAYCDKFELNAEQKAMVLNQDFLGILRAGANIYYMAKFCVPRGVSVQDTGAAFQGISGNEFRETLLKKREGLETRLRKKEDTGMAKIIGGVTTSHIPAVGNAISDGLTQEHYWKRFFDGYGPVKAWLGEKKPDVIIIVYNDHGLNFFLDKTPTFAIGCADEYKNADEGWGLTPSAPFAGDAELSWHLAESLIDQEFDMCTCQEMLVDHGFVNPMRVLFGDHEIWPVKTVPLAVNTVQHPLPSARRCYKLGQALKTAVDSYPEDLNVVVAGTGGMSHQLQGERAGIIDVEYDLACMESIINDPSWYYNQSNNQIMEKAGTEGIETIMWLTMRGALGDRVNCLHKHYHAPISNTGAGVLLLESA